MASFLKTASKQVADVRNFLRDSAGGNSLKYAAEKGAKHIVYIPYTSEVVVDEATGTEVPVKKLCAIQGELHEWNTVDGKYQSTICLKGVVIKDDDGSVVNDGQCPFCNRVTDAWDIYNYRKDLEEATCKLTGEQRKQHLEKTFANFRDERKAKDVRHYMYILIVKYRLNEQGKEVLGQDGLPEYDLKVMKLSSSRVEKIQQQIANSGSELPGSELIFEYPNTDDRRLLVGQSTTAPVFPNNQMIAKYPALKNKINADIAKFEWEGLEKSFPEWTGMSSVEATSVADSLFEAWDKYKEELKTNPQAKYLEYVVETPTAKPSLGTEDMRVAPSIPVIPGAPSIPVVPDTPKVPDMPETPEVPQIPTPDVNGIFNAGGNGETPLTI